MPTIRVVDVETTGEDPTLAEVIELGWQDVHLQHEEPVLPMLKGATCSFLYGSERPCPPEVLAVHHILDEERVGLPLFDRTSSRTFLSNLPEGTVAFAAHNAAFEQGFLHDSGQADQPSWFGLPWICTYKCALHLWPDAPRHTNQALRYWLGLAVDAERAAPPHRAGPDAYVTAAILQRMLEVTTLEQLLAWSAQPRPMPVFTFGKHKGHKITEVDRDYLSWIVNKSDMDADTKGACRLELERRARASRERMTGGMPVTGPAGSLVDARQMGLELTGCASALSLDQDP